MTRPRYTWIASIYSQSKENHYSCERTSGLFNLGSDRDHALDHARALLPVPFVETTTYTASRELRAAPAVLLELRQTRGHGPKAATKIVRSRWIEPEVRYVPSVGELGWTP